MKGRLALAAAAAAVVQVASMAQPGQVTLFVPAFDGPGSLGRNVATILNLQVWQTLRKAPTPNPANRNFGSGMVLWDDRPLAASDHESAERAARNNTADLVLWGKASRYGSGVVVQAFLTIPPSERPRAWEVTVQTPDGPAAIGVDLPRLRHQFRPLVLDPAIVDTYSTPDALNLYATPTAAQPIGVVGPEFTALEQGGRAARIRSGGTIGWVRLPALSTTRSEVVDFVGGVIRILRSDWDGAAVLLRQVLGNGQAPTGLKLDAHLLLAVALERGGGDGSEELRRAYALNPYDRPTVSYVIMGRLLAVARAPRASPQRGRLAAEARELLASHRYIFPDDDPWVRRVAAFLRAP